MAKTNLIQRLMIISALLASLAITSPVGGLLTVSASLNVKSAVTDSNEQIVTDHAMNELMADNTAELPVLTSASYDIDSKIDGAEEARSSIAGIGQSKEVSEMSTITSNWDFPDLIQNLEHKHGSPVGVEDIDDVNVVDQTFYDETTGSVRVSRSADGYHNYALVCANSKVHTDYCQNRRRGYYCSQNGYLNIQYGGTRYAPCEQQCECVYLGEKPACAQAYVGVVAGNTNCGIGK